MMKTIVQLREKYDLYATAERYTDADMPESDDKFLRH